MAPCLLHQGHQAQGHLITPNTFTSSNYAKPCLVSHSLGAVGVRMLALFTRPQSPGKSEGKRGTLCWAQERGLSHGARSSSN